MKAGCTIQEMCLEIQRQSEAKADYLINTASLRMEPWGNTPMLHVLDESGANQVEPLEILLPKAVSPSKTRRLFQMSKSRSCSMQLKGFPRMFLS